MKLLVGRREVVNPDLKSAVQVLSMFTLASPPPNKVFFDETCGQCKTKVRITLSETPETGEVWIDGPDKCETCGHQLSRPDAKPKMLSQEAIKGYFGEH
jgi:hypothetical protein